MQYKAVRMERRSAFRHEPDLVHHRPRVLRRIEIHVGRQVYMQGRALAVKDAGYFSDFPGRSEVFAACAVSSSNKATSSQRSAVNRTAGT